MRPYTMRMTPPFTMIGSSVAVVEESKHATYPKGSTIIILAGWIERGVVNPDNMGKASPGNTLGGVMKAADMGSLSKSLLLEAYGGRDCGCVRSCGGRGELGRPDCQAQGLQGDW